MKNVWNKVQKYHHINNGIVHSITFVMKQTLIFYSLYQINILFILIRLNFIKVHISLVQTNGLFLLHGPNTYPKLCFHHWILWPCTSSHKLLASLFKTSLLPSGLATLLIIKYRNSLVTNWKLNQEKTVDKWSLPLLSRKEGKYLRKYCRKQAKYFLSRSKAYIIM